MKRIATVRFYLLFSLLIAMLPALAMTIYSDLANHQPAAATLAEANRSLLAYHLATLALGAIVAAGLAWSVGSVLLLRPIRALSQTVHRLTAGDYGVRTGLVHQGGELAQLGRALDELASSLEQRESQRWVAEQDLRQSEERYRALVQASPCPIVLAAPNETILTANPEAVILAGYNTAEAVSGRNLADFVAPEALARLEEAKSRLCQTGTLRDFAITLLRSDGSRLPVELSVSLLANPEGQASAVIALQDISERQRAEEALRQSEIRYRALVEHSPAITYIARPEDAGETLYVSPQVESILGYSPAEYAGAPEGWLGHVHPMDRERVLAERKRSLETGEAFNCEYRMVARDGRPLWLADRAVLVAGDAAGAPFLQGFMLDITQRKEAEAELQRLNRALRVLSSCKHALLRVTTEQDLLAAACRIIVGEGGYRLAWIAEALQDPDRTVRPVASAGFDEGYLEGLDLTWASTERGHNPLGIAIRSRQPYICQDLVAHPDLAAACADAAELGFASVAALPLFMGGDV